VHVIKTPQITRVIYSFPRKNHDNHKQESARRKGGSWAGLVINDSRQILLAVALCLVGEKTEFKRAILSIKTKKWRE